MADIFWHNQQSSFGHKAQTGFDIPAPTGVDTDWAWMPSTPPEVTFNREIENPERLGGQAGVDSEPIIGGKDGGTFTFSIALRSQLDTYVLGSTPAVNPETQLIVDVLGGTVTDGNEAADIAAASDARVWNTASGAYTIGSFYAAGLTAALRAFGWVTSQVTTVVTMLETAQATPVLADDTYGTITQFLDTTQPTPRTFRVTGQDVTQDLRLIGCIPQSMTINFSARKSPTVEFSYIFTSFDYDSGGNGGFKTIIEYQPIPPIIGDNNGRMRVDGIADGGTSPDPMGTCNLSEVSLVVTLENVPLDCHSALEGVQGRIVADRMVRLNFTQPIEDTDLTGGALIWDTRLEDQTLFSVSGEVGIGEGAFMGFLAPAARVMTQPVRTIVNGQLVGVTVEAGLGPFAADVGSTNAANTTFRLAFG